MSENPGQVQHLVIQLDKRERFLLSVTLVCATLFFALAAGERIGAFLYHIAN